MDTFRCNSGGKKLNYWSDQTEFFQQAFTVMNMVSVHRLKSKMVFLPLMGGDAQGVSAPREAAEREEQRASVRAHARTH